MNITQWTKTVDIVVYTYGGTEVRRAYPVDKHTIAVEGDRPVKHLVTATLTNLKEQGVIEAPCRWVKLNIRRG